MISFAGLCRDLFLIAQLPQGRGSRGHEWECLVQRHLAKRGVRSDVLPGGYSLLGHTSLSGLKHQLDGTIASRDTFVIGEWKAYRGVFPKNELIRFKGVTDDFYLGLRGEQPARPVMRVFGGPGVATRELRRYAAIWGITLIDSDHWPAPVLASDRLTWPSIDSPEPTDDDCQRLTWLSRRFNGYLGGGGMVAMNLRSHRRRRELTTHLIAIISGQNVCGLPSTRPQANSKLYSTDTSWVGLSRREQRGVRALCSV